MKNIYLARLGRAFGPYSEDEIRNLESSGELKGFSWIWKMDSKKWEPLDPPPANPPAHRAEAHGAHAHAHEEAPAAATFRHDSLLPLDVICHNGRHAMTGAIRNITENGCELVCSNPSAESLFTIPSKVILSLFDSKTGQSLDISSQLKQMSRKEGKWNYSISWEKVPQLVLDSIAV